MHWFTPHYTLVSHENSQRWFICKYCVEIPDTFLEKIKQISSGKNSSDSNNASINILSKLQHTDWNIAWWKGSITKHTHSEKSMHQ